MKKAEAAILAGGLFGYRFQFPAARVGRHEVYWHRPVCAYVSASGEIRLLPDAPLGVLTAYEKGQPGSACAGGTLAAPAETPALFFRRDRFP